MLFKIVPTDIDVHWMNDMKSSSCRDYVTQINTVKYNQPRLIRLRLVSHFLLVPHYNITWTLPIDIQC